MKHKPTASQKRAAMLAAIITHGESLLAAFPKATERNPDTLSRKLHRIEVSLHRPILDYCNGERAVTCEQVDAVCVKALAKVCAILGIDEAGAKACGLFVNRDPRGYALKVDDSWTRAHNEAQRKLTDGRQLHSDWGGYGILAPDYSNTED